MPVLPAWVTLPAVALTGLALVLALAGCYPTTPEDRFAKSFCTATEPWLDDLFEIRSQVRRAVPQPGTGDRVRIQAFARRGTEINRRHARRLQALELAPEMERPVRVRARVQELTDEIVRRTSVAEQSLRSLPTSLTVRQSREAHELVERSLVEALAGVTPLARFVGKASIELQKAIVRARSCERLLLIGLG